MRRNLRAALAVIIATLAGTTAAHAVDSQEWELSSVDDFLAGEFDGVILEAPGTLRMGYAQQEIPVDAGQVWSVVQDGDGNVYAGTGNEGRVYIIAADGTVARHVELEGSQVYALAVDRQGAVFAASSPNGAIYRLTADGEPEEWYRPEAEFVWALLAGTDGALYAATGEPAQVLRVTGPQQGTVLYENAAPHFLSLAHHPESGLLVGTDGTGVLLRVWKDGSSRVLYDAPLAEVRSILAAKSGAVYFVAVQSSPGMVSPAAGLKLGGLTGEGDATNPKAGDNGGGKPETKAPAPRLGRRGATASVLYRLDGADRVVPVWTGKGQRVYSATQLGNDIVLGTDQQGTLIRLTPEGVAAVLYRGRAKEIVATATTPQGQLLLGTAETATVVRLGPGPPKTATYASAVQDAQALARYGQVRWAVAGDTRGPTLSARTGNTQEPDDGWSEWVSLPREGAGADALAPGRFLQVRLQWDAASAGSGVTQVNVPFAPRNLSPRVMKIAFEIAGRVASAPVNVGAEEDAQVLRALLKQYANGNGGKKNDEEPPTHSSDVKVTWHAVDPNGDTLEYALHFRGTGETLWKELETELAKAEYAWNSTLVPDGWYEVRVTASDRPSNTATDAADATLVSERVLVDNTGPVVSKLRMTTAGAGRTVRIAGQVEDVSLPLRRGRYALDGQPWEWFAPSDGIFDARGEAFVLEFADLARGEHTVAIQVLDAARNIGSGKHVFTVR